MLTRAEQRAFIVHLGVLAAGGANIPANVQNIATEVLAMWPRPSAAQLTRLKNATTSSSPSVTAADKERALWLLVIMAAARN